MEPPSRAEWGPIFWKMIHFQAISYADEPSDEEKEAALGFFKSLSNFLPCPECQGHFKKLLEELPVEPHLNSCKELTDWTHELHNRVNQRLGKPEITRQEFYKIYADENSEARSPVFTKEKELETPENKTVVMKELPKPVEAKKSVPVPAAQKARGFQHPVVQKSRTAVKIPTATHNSRAFKRATALQNSQPTSAVVTAERHKMGKRTLQVGPQKPVGYKATGCPSCK